MPINYLYSEYEVVRNPDRCIVCRVCERLCANEVHRYDSETGLMTADNSKLLRGLTLDGGAE